jgi:predicted transcriptional regulator
MNTPKTEHLSFRIERQLKQELRELAAREERSIAWIVVRAVERYLEQERRDEKRRA